MERARLDVGVRAAMSKFRRKPIIVEAEQWFPDTPVEGVVVPDPKSTTQFEPFVETYGVALVVRSGDWIVTDLKGEKYPVRNDVFQATYESAAYSQGVGDFSEIARELYEAYGAVTSWKNFRGEPMPNFADLPPKIQSAWEAAARQALQAGESERFEGWTSPRFRDANR